MKTQVRILIVLVLILMILGMFLVFSASGTYSEFKFNNIYFLFKSHLWKVIGAILAIIIFSLIPYGIYKRYSKYLLLAVILLLLATFLIAPKFKGAARWIDLGIISLQPSAIAILVLLIHLASFVERKGELIKDFRNGFRYALFWIFTVSLLVMIQPNISISLIIAVSSFALLFVGGSRLKHIFSTAFIALVLGCGAMFLFPHSSDRLTGYVKSLSGVGEQNLQVYQAKVGLGSGGILGVGIGHSRQSDLFLAESYGDFIFSVLGEELGFIGTVAVLSIFFTIFFIGVVISKNAKDEYGKLLGFAVSFNIIIIAFINAGVVTGLLPTTGITLPFISFGGTAIIIFAASIGILINIAKESVRVTENIPEYQ